MSWSAILALAAGAYLFKALGLLVLGPLPARSASAGSEPNLDGDDRGSDAAGDPRPRVGLATKVGQLLPAALLAALVVSQTVVTGTELTIDARLAGVAAGTVAVWRKAPFWLVLVIAATVTAGIRQLA